jgi:hypothetical protein
VLINAQAVQILQLLNPVNEQNPLQVIDLMVNDNSVKALKDTVDRLAPFIPAHDPEIVRARGFAVEPWDAQATVKVLSRVLRIGDRRVDQRKRLAWLSVCVRVSAQTDYNHSLVRIDLRGS